MGHDAIILMRMGWDMLHSMRMEMLLHAPLELLLDDSDTNLSIKVDNYEIKNCNEEKLLCFA